MELTFGLDVWELSYFSHILVYPADYKSPATGQYHKGETNMGGFICFSWKAFQEGYADPHDKINLGLHEFAHALRFNGVKGAPCDDFFENYFARWLACAYSEFRKLKHQAGQSIFRKYGGVNIDEFFSVAVETFFETPMEFKEALPALYRQTSILLNQTFSDEGRLVLHCREALIATGNAELSRAYPDAITHNLWSLGRLLMPMVAFILMGLVALLNGEHSYTFSCALIGTGIVLWLVLEWNYTRVFFDKAQVVIDKGFFIRQKWRRLALPYARLISFKHQAPPKDRPAAASRSSVAYYSEGVFYKRWLSIEPIQPGFDSLCEELRQNTVFVSVPG